MRKIYINRSYLITLYLMIFLTLLFTKIIILDTNRPFFLLLILSVGYFAFYTFYFQSLTITSHSLIVKKPFHRKTSHHADVKHYYIFLYDSKLRTPLVDKFYTHGTNKSFQHLVSIVVIMTKKEIGMNILKNGSHHKILNLVKKEYICDSIINEKNYQDLLLIKELPLTVSKDIYKDYKGFIDRICEEKNLKLIVY